MITKTAAPTALPSSSDESSATKRRKQKSKQNALDDKLNKPKPSVSRLQLSLLNSGLLPAAEEEKAMAFLPEKPLDANEFSKHVALLRKYEVLLRMEFQLVTKGENHSIRHATKDVNEPKNSYKRYLPYDYNRVCLEPLPGIPDSDYVNASHIDGILKPNAYIATQGPNDNSIADFWRMVWEQKCQVICMLTKVFDFIRVMCVQYWPMECNHPETFGDIQVNMLSETSLANYFVRHFILKRGDEEQEVWQLHLISWPTHTSPFPSALLDFRRRVRMYSAQYPDSGPLIVHCSDGCARTGTYLCIDANLELAEEDGVYDVFGYSKVLRQARKGMLDSFDLYRFTYEALEEARVCGRTCFPVDELAQQMKLKSLKNPVTKLNEYQREYQKICKMSAKFTIGDRAGGHRLENRDKNRSMVTVPPDNFRPYLSSFQNNDSTDYINAVFVDGFLRAKQFIVTEWPMPRTVPEIWSLAYDHDCNSIVVLSNPTSTSSYPIFWPNEREKKKKFGAVFTIEVVSHNHYPNVKSWILRILKKVVSLTELMSGVKAEPKTTQLFFLSCWPPGHKVPISTNSLVEMMNMVERWRQRTTYGPILVVSTNGKSRSGVYCAASLAMEQAIEHNEVDVFTAVKTVRRHRPQLVENMTEYKYCYDVLLHYTMNFLHKE